MRTFREFLERETTLLLEFDGGDGDASGGSDGGGDGASRQFGYQLIYPVYADEGKWALNNPVDDRGVRSHGRKLHNIDLPKLKAVRFKSIISRTAPEAGPGFWEHKPDIGNPSSLEVTDEDELYPIGFGTDSKHPRKLVWDKPNPGDFGYNSRYKDFPSDL